MKCTKCGQEIEEGKFFCGACGTEVTMVPEYQVVEDEVFLEFMKQEQLKMQEDDEKKSSEDFESEEIEDESDEIGEDDEEEAEDEGEDEVEEAEEDEEESVFTKKKLVGWIIGTVGFFVFFLLLTSIINGNDILVAKEEVDESFVESIVLLDNKEYDAAVNSFNRRLVNDEYDLNPYFWSAAVCRIADDKEGEIEALNNALKNDDDNIYACRRLVEIYLSDMDFDGFYTLYESMTGKGVSALFKDYIIDSPVFGTVNTDPKPGDTLEIKCEPGLNVYYTVDGSSPYTNGQIYYNPIALELGEYTIKAVSCNANGYYSRTISMDISCDTEYELDYPSVFPAGGQYTIAQTIKIDVPANCQAYYTWDGTTPTDESTLYEDTGIAMISGNNVLSVILYDSYGNSSPVLKTNYIYLPSSYQGTTTPQTSTPSTSTGGGSTTEQPTEDTSSGAQEIIDQLL